MIVKFQQIDGLEIIEMATVYVSLRPLLCVETHPPVIWTGKNEYGWVKYRPGPT